MPQPVLCFSTFFFSSELILGYHIQWSKISCSTAVTRNEYSEGFGTWHFQSEAHLHKFGKEMFCEGGSWGRFCLDLVQWESVWNHFYQSSSVTGHQHFIGSEIERQLRFLHKIVVWLYLKRWEQLNFMKTRWTGKIPGTIWGIELSIFGQSMPSGFIQNIDFDRVISLGEASRELQLFAFKIWHIKPAFEDEPSDHGNTKNQGESWS